jgi:hypothetical protein
MRSAFPPSSTRSAPESPRAPRRFENIQSFRRPAQMLGFSYDWDARGRHHRSQLREVDAVDLPPALQEGARVPAVRYAGELVSGARHRSLARRGRSSTGCADAAAIRASACRSGQ